MNYQSVARGSIRVLLFGCCLLAALFALSVVLQSQIVNVTIIGLLAITTIIAVLIGMGTITNKLWRISGLITNRVIDMLFIPKNGIAAECSDGKERSA